MPPKLDLAGPFRPKKVLNIPEGNDRSGWPVASSEYLHCWNAIEEAGAAIHGPEWSSGDLLATVPTAFSPEAVRANLPTETDGSDDSIWEAAQTDWLDNIGAHARLLATIQWLDDELRNGRVIAHKLRAGEMMALPAKHWFGQAIGNSALNAGRVEGQWLFIGRRELMSKLATLREPEIAVPTSADGLHLSPYMKLMLAIAEDVSITPDNQPTIESLKAEIARLATSFGLQVNPHWGDKGRPDYKTWLPDKGFAELSGKMLDAMPSLLREISEQARRG